MPPKVDPKAIVIPPPSKGKKPESVLQAYSNGPLSKAEQQAVIEKLVQNKNLIAFALLSKLSEWIKAQPENIWSAHQDAASSFSRQFLQAITEAAKANQAVKVRPNDLKIQFYEAFMGEPWPDKTDMPPELARKDSVRPGAASAASSLDVKGSPEKARRTGVLLHRTSSDIKDGAYKLWSERGTLSPEKEGKLKGALVGMIEKQKAARAKADALMLKFFTDYPQLARFLNAQVQEISGIGQAFKADLREKEELRRAEEENRKRKAEAKNRQEGEVSSSVETEPATSPEGNAASVDAASADDGREQKRSRFGSPTSAFYRLASTKPGAPPATSPGPT